MILGMWRSTIGYASLLALLPSCMGGGSVVGPLPEPVSYQGSFDTELITLTPQGEQTSVTGGPGAAKDGVEMVTVDNLDRLSGRARVEVAADGSFTVEVDGSPDNVFRLQGTPQGVVDITSESPNGGPVIYPEHFQSCLVPQTMLSYDLEVQIDEVSSTAETTFSLMNICDEPVVLTTAALLYGDAGFDVRTDLRGTQIDPWQSAELDIAVECDALGEQRDLYVLDTDGGRLVVSLSVVCQE